MTRQTLQVTTKQGPTAVSKQGFLISISGIDGSGKSSNALALWENLRNQGLPAVQAWAGLKPALSYPFLAVVRLLGYTRRIRVRGLVFFRRDLRRNRAILKLWPLVVALDFFPKALVSVWLPLKRRKVIVSDRYVFDLLAELIQETNIGAKARNLLLNMVPRPNIAFLIDVDHSLAWERAMVPGRAREQPYYDLAERRKVYLDLAREYGMIVLDGSDQLSRNSRQILQQTLGAMQQVHQS